MKKNETAESVMGNRQYSIKQAGAILNYSTKSIYRLLERKLLVSNRALRHHRISEKSINDFINNTK
jgi:hypothetical protein